MRDVCLERAPRPDLPPRARLNVGRYWRSAEREDVPKRYSADSDKSPRWGYKVRADKWRWRGGLSVNSSTCACARCCIELHPTPGKYQHAVCIDLANLARETGVALAAVYDPIVDGEDEMGVRQLPNPCHFNVVPEDEAIEDAMFKVRKYLEHVFPAHMPHSPADVAAGEAALAKWRTVFEVVRDAKSLEPAAPAPA